METGSSRLKISRKVPFIGFINVPKKKKFPPKTANQAQTSYTPKNKCKKSKIPINWQPFFTEDSTTKRETYLYNWETEPITWTTVKTATVKLFTTLKGITKSCTRLLRKILRLAIRLLSFTVITFQAKENGSNNLWKSTFHRGRTSKTRLLSQKYSE